MLCCLSRLQRSLLPAISSTSAMQSKVQRQDNGRKAYLFGHQINLLTDGPARRDFEGRYFPQDIVLALADHFAAILTVRLDTYSCLIKGMLVIARLLLLSRQGDSVARTNLMSDARTE